MARPCKSAKVLTENSQTKEEISERAKMEDKLRGEKENPKPPNYLSKSQKKIFKNIVKYLDAADIIGAQDVYLITLCAIALDRLETIEKMINENPELIGDRDLGSAKTHYTQDFMRCCNELSLSPQSRSKMANLALQKKQAAEDPVLRLLEGGADK